MQIVLYNVRKNKVQNARNEEVNYNGSRKSKRIRAGKHIIKGATKGVAKHMRKQRKSTEEL